MTTVRDKKLCRSRLTGVCLAGLCLLGVALLIGVLLLSGGQSRSTADATDDVGVMKAAAKSESSEQGRVEFARDVLPILSNHCFHCHGPDQDSKEAKRAGFRLDLRDDAVAFDAIVPGDPESSLMMDVLTTKKASRRMPPLDSGKPQLKPEQVETLRQWIAAGAEYTDHWSFVKPTKPAVPDVPEGADPQWATNDIDRFIQAKLHANGLEPNKPADRNRLIRRVYLDLIGLPPTPQQAKAFVNDPSPDAYERAVDALLAMPQFGERWARQWLD